MKINTKKFYNHLKASAKRRNIHFDLSLTELNNLTFPVTCPLLGIRLDYDRFTEFSPSLDRIDNSLGYIDGNIQIISIKANKMKNNASDKELESFAKAILCF